MVELYTDNNGYVYMSNNGEIYRIILVRVAEIYDIAKTILYDIMDFISNDNRRNIVVDNIIKDMTINDIYNLLNVPENNGKPIMFHTNIGTYIPLIVDIIDNDNIYNNIIYTNIEDILGGKYE